MDWTYLDLPWKIILPTMLSSGVVAGVISNLMSARQTKQANKRAADYSAIRVATTLEQFVRSSIGTLSNSSLATLTGGLVGKGKIELPPAPSYPADVDWKLLRANFIERVFSLTGLIEHEVRGQMEMIASGEPVDDSFAILGTVKCAGAALRLAADLRAAYRYQPNEQEGEQRKRIQGYQKMALEMVDAEAKRRAALLKNPVDPAPPP